MKVLLVNKFFYRKGGSETYYFALGEALKQAGHEVIWFSMQHSDNLPCGQSEYFAENVDYHANVSAVEKLKNVASMIYSGKNRKKFESLLLAERPDIVHINNVHKQITLSILDSCEAHNIPVVATSHDWTYICPNYLKLKDGVVCELCQDGAVWNCFKTGCVQGSKLKSLLSTLEAVYNRRSGKHDKIDLYVAPSNCMAEKMKSARFTNSEVIWMCNFLPDLDVKITEPTNPRYFVYMGRLIGEKGVETLIRAYEKADVAAELYILGDGPLRGDLEEFTRSQGMQARIHFTGTVHGDELAGLVGGSLAVIVPSEWLENCPYSVMEALAMGKPVIGSEIGGIPELIENEVTGYCFEMKNVQALAEAMQKLESLSVQEYDKMSEAARAWALEHFSGQAYVSDMVGHYEKLLNKKGTAVWR